MRFYDRRVCPETKAVENRIAFVVFCVVVPTGMSPFPEGDFGYIGAVKFLPLRFFMLLLLVAATLCTIFQLIESHGPNRIEVGRQGPGSSLNGSSILTMKNHPADSAAVRETPRHIELPPLDLESVFAEKRAFEAKNPGRVRFAHRIPVAISPDTVGTWIDGPQDEARWSLSLRSPGAASLNIGFSRYRMPEGGELRITLPDGAEPYRSFTSADNEVHNELWTPLFPGDQVTLTVRVPKHGKKDLAIQLASINHGLKSDPREKSSNCNIDTVCSVGDLPVLGNLIDAYRDQIRSTAFYTIDGTDTCSGVLINNTARDGRPYFLTAAHCEVTEANARSMVVYWNYENSVCRAPGSDESGRSGDGSREIFNSGAIFRASYEDSDFCLVELDDVVPPEANVFYAGWDRSGKNADMAVGIHHPSTDEKRISFSFEETQTTNYGSYRRNDFGTHFRVVSWDNGTTEGGSSGSPLFNENKQVIGQLHGGDADCNTLDSDWYGRLNRSWSGGGSASRRLSDWLDPEATGELSIEGINAQSTLSVEDAGVMEGHEGETKLPVQIALDPPNENKTVKVRYRTLDGTAKSGRDFVKVPPTEVVFEPGETRKTVEIVILPDSDPEQNETFVVELISPENAFVSRGRAEGRVFNDDFILPESPGPLTFHLEQDKAVEEVIEFRNTPTAYALDGDYPESLAIDDQGVMRWDAGETGVFEFEVVASNPAGSVSETVRLQVAANPLRAALDGEGLPWVTSGQAWVPQSAETSDGDDAAASAVLDDGEFSWIETEVSGPDYLLFQWRTSSEEFYDELVLSLDGDDQERLSGITPWTPGFVKIPEGEDHKVRWRYKKDASDRDGDDRAYLDQVFLASRDVRPHVVMPSTIHVVKGVAVELPVEVTGNPTEVILTDLPPGLSRDGNTISGTPEAAGDFRVTVTANSAAGSDSAEIAFAVGVPLQEAADADYLTWTTGGDAEWIGQAQSFTFGESALESGRIGNDESSWIETMVTGPDHLIFWTRTSTEEDADFLEIDLDGERELQLSGETSWTRRILGIPPGNHTVRFSYEKDVSIGEFQDRVWVDHIELASQSEGPVLLGPALAAGETGKPFKLALDVEGMPESFMASGLPAGLTISNDGIISGSTNLEGRAEVVVTASNAAGENTLMIVMEFNKRLFRAGEAVDNFDVFIYSPGQRAWRFDALKFFKDGDSLRSGPISNDVSSKFGSVVHGPGKLRFRWSVSSEEDFDELELSINERMITSISGEVGWTEMEVSLGAGTNLIGWTYSKDGSGSSGSDRAWVDAFELEGYASWIVEKELTVDSRDIESDPDGDGLNNFVEYALGLDPLLAERSALPVPEYEDGRLVIRIDRPADRSDVFYAVEVSDTLEPDSWHSGGLEIVEDSESQLVMRDEFDAATNQRRFMRLRLKLIGD